MRTLLFICVLAVNAHAQCIGNVCQRVAEVVTPPYPMLSSVLPQPQGYILVSSTGEQACPQACPQVTTAACPQIQTPVAQTHCEQSGSAYARAYASASYRARYRIHGHVQGEIHPQGGSSGVGFSTASSNPTTCLGTPGRTRAVCAVVQGADGWYSTCVSR